MGTLKERKPNEPNPFVVGEDTVDRFLTVLGECALATKAYVEAGQPGKEKKDEPAAAAAARRSNSSWQRARPGHPRFLYMGQDVDARVKRGMTSVVLRQTLPPVQQPRLQPD